MQCVAHPDITADARCTGCAESFCHACLVEVAGQRYCAKCKSMAVIRRPVVESEMSLCAEAKSALTMSILGIFLFSFILGPMSVYKGVKARDIIHKDPRLTGSGLAAAAIVIGILVSLMGIINLVSKAKHP